MEDRKTESEPLMVSSAQLNLETVSSLAYSGCLGTSRNAARLSLSSRL